MAAVPSAMAARMAPDSMLLMVACCIRIQPAKPPTGAGGPPADMPNGAAEAASTANAINATAAANSPSCATRKRGGRLGIDDILEDTFGIAAPRWWKLKDSERVTC